MSPAAALDESRAIAVALERREKARFGGTRDAVRRRVATRVRVAPGTLENIVRGRLKRLESWVHERLRQAWLAELKKEIGRHDVELARALRSQGYVPPDEIAEMEAGLAALRAGLAELEGFAPPGSSAPRSTSLPRTAPGRGWAGA